MAKHLSVSAIRRAIYAASDRGIGDSDPSPSTSLLGRIFHESLAKLSEDDDHFGWSTPLANADESPEAWCKALEDHVYERIVGPALARERSHLQSASAEVISFWEAIKQACKWLSGVLWTIRQCNEGDSVSETKASATEAKPRIVFRPEEPLSCEFTNPSWSDSVLVSGIADLILALPHRPDSCIIEYKIGKACPEADLAQAAIYHRILSKQYSKEAASLALLSFKPECQERLFDSASLKEAQSKLEGLIARLAGVAPGSPAPGMEAPYSKQSKPPARAYEKESRGILETFAEYGKEIRFDGNPIIGPAFIRYPVVLGKKVKLSDVQKIASELQHRLRLSTAPIVGVNERGRVVIDIQRSDRQVVSFDELRDQLPKSETPMGSSLLPLGVKLDGKLRFVDLAEPEDVHILVAGTTGSGKSEWLRTAIAGLISSNTPESLSLVLIDPKRNAFNELQKSPFLHSKEALVYPDEIQADEVLQKLAQEMEKRYRIFQDAGVDCRNDYVQRSGRAMARIVCICDEYYDLINRGKKYREGVESQIFRLGAKARAAAIHLIIATQQPSRKVIKGALDANIPARIGLKMNKAMESNMLLGTKGAERLLGNGDLLFKDIGEPERLQALLLSEKSRRQLFHA